MPDTTITMTPSGTSGSVTVTASSASFAATDVGRLLAIKDEAPQRLANTAYAVGIVFHADDRGVKRLFRVVGAGTTAVQNLAGTVPNYDLNSPTGESLTLRDGTAVIRYLGRGKSAWGWGKISVFTSTTLVTVDVAADGTLSNTTAALHWRLGEFGGGRGYPRAGCFYQNRLVLGGSAANPQGVWTSETGDFEKFSPCDPDGVVLDTNGVTQTVTDDEMSTVIFLTPGGRGVVIGTTSGAFLFGPSSQSNRVLSPSNSEAKRQSDEGAIDTTAGLRIGGATLYVDATGRKTRELVYDFAIDAYQDGDLNLLSEHIAGTGMLEIAHQSSPEGVLWAVCDDGRLLSLTYDKDQQVRAWGRHILGGTIAMGVQVESVCCVPAPNGKSDDVYVSVKRVIAGVTRRWIEVIREPFRAERDGAANAFHVDAGLTYSGAPVTSVTGLSHLEGLTVRVVADGAVRTSRLVTAGAIYIDTPAASVVHAGLAMTSRAKMLPLEGGAAQGTAMGRPRRVSEIRLRLLETGAVRVGKGADMETVDFRTPADAMDTAVPLFTGIRKWTQPGGWDDDYQLTFESHHGLPLTVLGVAMEVIVEG